MDWIQGIVLGLVQGLGEFLPISSSGHLVLVPTLLHWPEPGLAFNAVLHLGTLAAVIWYFRRDLWSLARRSVQGTTDGQAARIFILKLAVASIPALAAALIFNHAVEQYAYNSRLVAFNLGFWALFLFAADHWSKKRPDEGVEQVSWRQALTVGLAQPLALLPGTSRSGITITAGLFVGLSRAAAARFSFLLAIPVTAAAGAYEMLKILQGESLGQRSPLVLIVGCLVALLSGLAAIRFLLNYVAKHRYDAFVVYRLALAFGVLLVV